MPTKPMADAVQTLAQLFRPPAPVAPGGPSLPERLPEDDTNPFMLIMDAIRGATYGAEDSRAAKFGALMSAMAPVVGGPMAAMKGLKGAQAAETAGEEAVHGIKAYHGSPHVFDRFDSSKIGTGQSAQSYGHGLYFAENEGVAKSYRNELTQDRARFVDQHNVGSSSESVRIGLLTHLLQSGVERPLAQKVSQEVVQGALEGGDLAHMRKFVRQSDWSPEEKDAWSKALDAASQLTVQKPPGAMYEVNIKADPAQFLSWDQPLKDQPELLAKIRAQVEASGLPVKDFDANVEAGISGANAYHNWVPGGGHGGAGSSATLQRAGIPGIRYLDQGSRTVTPYAGDPAYRHAAESFKQAGQLPSEALTGLQQAYKTADRSQLEAALADVYGFAPKQTHNYVMFPGTEDLIDILKKYGIPAALAGTLAKYAQQQPGAQQQ